MSAEEESKNNGGTAMPPEPEAECPEEVGRPASLSFDAPPDENSEEDEEDLSAGAPQSREELERKYRNDPRFDLLFHHKRKLGQKGWYIKVGGIRLTAIRILILSGFLLVFLICLGACFFYAFKDLGKYRNYSRAASLYKAGDYDAAKEMFLKVLAEDPNKEDAIAAMADIYRKDGDWGNEAFFRQRLMRLNPLDQNLRTDFLESAFRARNYAVVYSFLNLRLLEGWELSPDEGALYVIAALHSGHIPNGKSFYDLKRKNDPKFFRGTERGRFVELKMSTKEMDAPRSREFLAFLKDAQDPMVRFETIDSLLYYYATQDEFESEKRMEELLLEATELNNFAGAPLLASFYFMRYRFDDTIKVCEKYLETKVNAIMPILLGESYALSGRTEKILPLEERMQKLHGRQSKIIASYLDAVNSFCLGDNDRLRDCLLEAGSTINTPLSGLMSLQIALLTDSTKGIRQNLEKLIKGPPFMDFPQRARTAALHYLMEKAQSDLASDPEKLYDFAEIAVLLETPGDNVSFYRRIILLDRFNRNVMTADELTETLEKYPSDNILLQIASKYYLLNDKPARAMDYIVEFNKLKDAPGKDTVAILHMVALDQLGRKDDAEKEFRAIVEKGEDDSLCFLYYAFCVDNNFIESLKSFATWLGALPKDSPSRSILPFVRAEILFADDATKNRALEIFEKSDTADSRFVFRAALRLAEAGRLDAALRRLLSIRETYPDKVLLNIEISMIYGKKGDKKSELAYARTAWQLDKNNLSARHLYAKCLFEGGQVADAFSVLGSPLYRTEFPPNMLSLWEKVVRAQLKTDFDSARYTPAMENARRLLTFFPDDKEAREYLDKIENIRLLEKNSVRQ